MDEHRKTRGGLPRRSSLIALGACFGLTLSAPAPAGTTFGIYDARTLAMGGASVASADNGNGQFYNAALLAFNDEIEERTTDARFWFPLLIPQVSESGLTVEEVSRDGFAQAITTAVNEFNAASDDLTAQAVVDATANLDASLADIDGQDLFADIYVGLGGGEAGKHRGTGFFLGARWLAGGKSTVTPGDRSLLAAYQEGLTFIATNGIEGIAHPELFDANGALIDPVSGFESTVSAAGAVITEAGVAMSRQTVFFGQPIAVGLSVKVQRIDTFEDVERLVDDRVDVGQNSDYVGNLNFDLGFARAIGDNWRVGLAVKDLIPQNHKTSLGTPIRLRPRARIGAAFTVGQLQIAADVDLSQNEPLGGEATTQEAALGAEWSLDLPIKLRAGYRHDMQGNRDGIASLGVGTIWKRLAIDLAVAGGGDARAGGLQFGVVF